MEKKAQLQNFLQSLKENTSSNILNNKINEIKLDIPNITNNDNLPSDNLINDTLLDVQTSPRNNISLPSLSNIDMEQEAECPFTHKRGKISGCPFMNAQSTEIKSTKFEYHYEIPFPESVRDFRFNRLNYKTEEDYNKSKKLREYPSHLRNTLYIKDERILNVRQKEYTVAFLICEEIKEKAYKAYTSKDYKKAIAIYSIIYSILKWLNIKDPVIKDNYLNHFDFSKDCGLKDDDIEVRLLPTDEKYSYEYESYKAYLINILKSLAYCYLHLNYYTESIKCIDEALPYANASKNDLLFRKIQAIMHNKFSSLKKLEKIKEDLEEIVNKDKKEIYSEYLEELTNLVNKKKYEPVGNVIKLLEDTLYSYDIIKKKKLNVHEHIYCQYDDIHFNSKIVEEMKETYFSSIKFYQENNKEERLKTFIPEFEKFFDFYLEYVFYYNLKITNLKEDFISLFPENYKNAINEMKNNNVLLLLFNDYRLKKCEKLYDDYDWNITFWKYCFKTVNEIEKKKQKKNEKNKKWYEWKLIQNPLSSNQYALFTIIFVTISLLAILYQVFFVDNDDANAKFNK